MVFRPMEKFDPKALVFDEALAKQLTYDMVGEILKSVRLKDQKVTRSIVTFITGSAARGFAEVMADFDRVIGHAGLHRACGHILQNLVQGYSASGVEAIPLSGPVVVAANHPGTYDVMSLAASLPREDVKIIAAANPFFRHLLNSSRYLFFSTQEQTDRVEVIRKGIHHLMKGGLLLYFPYGHITPDPAVMAGAEETIRSWSRSLEIFLRKVPPVTLVLGIVSGVISRKYIDHPLPNLFKDFERRRIIEFLQMIRQMARHIRSDLHPCVSFEMENTKADEGVERMDAIRRQEIALLKKHMQYFHPAG
jgi:hypothetical protein